MSMSKNHQAGSAVTFVIIAVILAVLTIGGVALVVQRGEQARKDAAASKLAEQEADDKKTQDDAKPTPAPSPTPSTDTPTPNDADNGALPATGPEQDFARTLVVALLVVALTSFVLSRRAFKRSL